MSGSSTPVSGKQERTMSSRLLTMKFMQRAAASASNRPCPSSSSVPASPIPDPNGHPAKRLKLSSPAPQSPGPNPSTPHSFHRLDDPSTPLAPDRSKDSTQQTYGGNAAETPWILNPSRAIETPGTPKSPWEDISPEEPAIGRRTFGNFKKKPTEKMAVPKAREDVESLSSGDQDDSYEHTDARVHEMTLQDVEGTRGKRRQIEENDWMDKINLKKLRSGGISASSSMRKPGSDAKAFRKDARKG